MASILFKIWDRLRSQSARNPHSSCPVAPTAVTPQPGLMFNEINRAPNLPLAVNAIEEMIIANQYKIMKHLGVSLPGLKDSGYSIYSESDEDGILNYIFSLIGCRHKKVVDIGAAAIDGSNSANLIINHGWTGLLIEASDQNVEIAQGFYGGSRATKNYPPRIINQWVTAENVNQVLKDNAFDGEVDLLCIDIDGIDFWLWKAIEVTSPRVVVIEYQCIWGPDRAVTIPYHPEFRGKFSGHYGIYSGASLAAMVKLGRGKGYRLVGCQKYGYNAFFVRNDCGQGLIPEIAASECFTHPFTTWARDKFLAEIQDLEWVEV